MSNDLTPTTTTTAAASLVRRVLTLDQMITVWLQEKTNRTHSKETKRAYTAHLNDFRATLQAVNLDLDGDPQLVALAAQGWADHNDELDDQGQPLPVHPTTYNRRLAILSSFYQTAIKRGFLITNPITSIDRRPTQPYAGVKALDRTEVSTRLAQIDRSTLAGLRDYALIVVLLTTGRRRAEVCAMRWSSLHIDSKGAVTVEFLHTKGGKVMRDTLTARVSKALLTWLHAFYGPALGDLRHDAPIWVSLSDKSRGKPLTVRTFNDICKARIGESKVHSLRHTFAGAMEDAGAKLTEIRDRLGHSSSHTTDKYLQGLRQARNRYGEQIENMFSLDDDAD